MKQKILLIDDDIDLCRLLRNNLEREGYFVRTCHDGVTGLEEAQGTDFQLVILECSILSFYFTIKFISYPPYGCDNLILALIFFHFTAQAADMYHNGIVGLIDLFVPYLFPLSC